MGQSGAAEEQGRNGVGERPLVVERLSFTVLETLGRVGAVPQRFPDLGAVVLGLHYVPHIYIERERERERERDGLH